jgi:phosphatidylinositol alpha-mannosyltransferase
MVTEYAYPVLGGVPEHVHNLSRELAARGHEVTVLTSLAPLGMKRRARDLDAENLAVHGYRTLRMAASMPFYGNGSVARVSIGMPGLKVRVTRALRGMDVVHAQGLAVPTLPLYSLRTSLAPVTVGTFHTYFERGHWGYRYFLAYVKSTLARTDRLIAVSEPCITAMRPYFTEQDFEIIPNGIDTDLYRPLAPSEARPDGPPRILFVGRFDPRNALDTMLDAARILADEGRDFVLQVVGDGPLRPKYHHQAKALGVDDRVEWLGLLDKERPRLYREATVFAVPCVLASFGVVLLEAMASGTPVVCADNIGFRQVIRDGAPGRFVPPRDAAALAAGIAQLLDDPATRADWGARGRELAVEQYAWPTIARRVEDLYREIIDAKRGAPPPPPMGLRFNLKRSPIELARNLPKAIWAGFRAPLRRPSEPGRGDAPEGG